MRESAEQEKTLDETIAEMEDVVGSLREELEECQDMLRSLRRQRDDKFLKSWAALSSGGEA